MNLFCLLGFHKYSDVKHRPCERFKTCFRCGKEKVFPGWHRFGDWSKTYYTDVTYTYGGDPVDTVRESKKNRYCNDCQLYDEWTLK
jgi:hypothetical protein